MKAVWTETTGELIDLMKSRGVNRDSCVGTVLLLATEANHKKMLQWIKRNPQAGQYEILGELDVFKPKAECHSMPSRSRRKIAVF